MSIFESLKNAIFRHGGASAPPPPKPPGTPVGTPRAPTQASTSAAPAPATPAATPAKPQAMEDVDIEAVLDGMNAKNPQKLAWRTSIVDLMKLVGADSSFQHRKELALELGFTGDTGDSAAMNIWLHKAFMKKLAENGGKLPASLLH